MGNLSMQCKCAKNIIYVHKKKLYCISMLVYFFTIYYDQKCSRGEHKNFFQKHLKIYIFSVFKQNLNPRLHTRVDMGLRVDV